MSKFIAYLIPVLILALFVVVMKSGYYLKKPLGKDENIIVYINVLKTDIKNKNWRSANIQLAKLKKAFKEKIIPRIQYSVERRDINDIIINLARLNGSVEAKDEKSAMAEIYVIKENWNQLGK